MQLTFLPHDPDLGPFEMGHMIATGNLGEARSQDVMMLAISTVDFLSGTASLYDRRDGAFNFEGIESHFWLRVEKSMQGEVVVTHGKQVIHRSSDAEFTLGLLNSTKAFWMIPERFARLDPAEQHDLQMAIAKLERLLETS